MAAATRKRAAKRQPKPAVRPALHIACGYCGGGAPAISGLETFALTYAAAEACGWRQDLFRSWTCPACAAQPGWMAPNLPKLASDQPAPLPRRVRNGWGAHRLDTTGGLAGFPGRTADEAAAEVFPELTRPGTPAGAGALPPGPEDAAITATMERLITAGWGGGDVPRAGRAGRLGAVLADVRGWLTGSDL